MQPNGVFVPFVAHFFHVSGYGAECFSFSGQRAADPREGAQSSAAV